MTERLSIENLQSISAQTGLKLPEDELQRLLPGVNRARKQAAELRELVAAGDEPAAAFDASGKSTK
jgi:hypothetical protein